MQSKNFLYSKQELKDIIESSLICLDKFKIIQEDFRGIKSEFCNTENRTLNNFDDYCSILEDICAALKQINIEDCNKIIKFVNQKLIQRNNSNKHMLKPLTQELRINQILIENMLKVTNNVINLLETNLEKILSSQVKNAPANRKKVLNKIYDVISVTNGLSKKIESCYRVQKGEKIYVIKVENCNHEKITILKEKLSEKVETIIHIKEDIYYDANTKEIAEPIKIVISTAIMNGRGINAEVKKGISTDIVFASYEYFRFIDMLSTYKNMFVPICDLCTSKLRISNISTNSDYKDISKKEIQKIYEKFFSGLEWENCLNKAYYYAEKLAQDKIGKAKIKEIKNKKDCNRKTKLCVMDRKYYLHAYILFDKYSRKKLKLIAPNF